MHRDEILQLPALVQDYLRYISVVKNKSNTTVSEYASDLRTFFRFLKALRLRLPTDDLSGIDVSDLDDSFMRSVTLNDAYEFLYYCKNERSNDAASRARKTSAIRQFFQYLTNNKGLLETDPMANLDSPKLKRRCQNIFLLRRASVSSPLLTEKIKSGITALSRCFSTVGCVFPSWWG